MTGAPRSANVPKSGGRVAAEFTADLAAASRILAERGVVDAAGHISHRHPKSPDRFLMSRAMAPALVTPDDVIEYSLDSEPCNADGRSSFLERFIHGGIYKARPDVHCVIHSHSPSVIPFGLVDTPMRAMFHNAAFLAEGVPVFDISQKFGATDMLIGDKIRGGALAERMGDRSVVLMRAHGLVACGPSLQLAVFRAVYTEVNARIQHWTAALAGGRPLASLSEEEGRLADVANSGASARAWELWRGQVREQVNW
ncbi:MAG: class II aldolase/adducin family protein [Alphaproteobacteria bacterium]|nr:class II aldolase/adducin family protein [Alphaproteobacteria bacterium]